MEKFLFPKLTVLVAFAFWLHMTTSGEEKEGKFFFPNNPAQNERVSPDPLPIFPPIPILIR